MLDERLRQRERSGEATPRDECRRFGHLLGAGVFGPFVCLRCGDSLDAEVYERMRAQARELGRRMANHWERLVVEAICGEDAPLADQRFYWPSSPATKTDPLP